MIKASNHIGQRIIATIVILGCTVMFALGQTFFGMTKTGGSSGGGTIYRVNSDGSGLTTEFEFPIEGHQLHNMDFCQMTKLANGKMYGVSPDGGKTDQGVLFEYDPATNIYTKKIDFNERVLGINPFGSLTLVNGKLYGMTRYGGDNYRGVIFEYDPVANTYLKKLDFDGALMGENPFGRMTLYNGKLYGMTAGGGTFGFGVLFEYDPLSNGFQKKVDFDGAAKGNLPLRDLALAANNMLYGMTVIGGINDKGVLFEFDPSTGNYTKKIDFDGAANGAAPIGTLVLASNNKMYGTTNDGGTNAKGVLFEFDPSNGNFTKKVDFDGPLKGTGGGNIMVQAPNGKLYGTSESGGVTNAGVIYEFDPGTGAFAKKFDFNWEVDGGAPKSGLTLADNNKLYGSAAYGGQYDHGTIFEFNPATGAFAKMLDFNSASKGSYPEAGLTLLNEKLYGITTGGGSRGFGVIFEYNPLDRLLLKKKDFDDHSLTGSRPVGDLAVGPGGKLYGVTTTGGNSYMGVLYEYDPGSNTITKKVDFSGIPEGRLPSGGLTAGPNGKFYGMTRGGGTNDNGVIYSFDPGNGNFAKGHDFASATGRDPISSLALGGNGKFYGLTLGGGTNNLGVLFEFNPVGDIYQVKVNFDGILLGSRPEGSLVLHATNGKLYGCTREGGVNNFGVLFDYDPTSDTFSKNVDFGGLDGTNPMGKLTVSPNGKLYGTTNFGGGDDNLGTLFEFDPVTGVLTSKSSFTGPNGASPRFTSLALAVVPPQISSFSPASGPVGTSVTIVGASFGPTAGENIVYFGATRATVTNASPSALTVTVPLGATYQPVTVTVNGLTAHSKGPFKLTFPFAGSIGASFAARVSLPAGVQTKRATTADLDGDGKPDIVAADEGSNVVLVFRNTSSIGSISLGSFVAQNPLATGAGTYMVAAGDLDGDGKIDLAVTGGQEVSVFRNTSTVGSITFGPKVGLPLVETAEFLAIHDLDGDGKPELIASTTGSYLSVFRNISTPGSITPASFEAHVDFLLAVSGCCAWSVATGDIDGDGKPEMVAPDFAGNVSIFRNTSVSGPFNSGSFAPKLDLPTGIPLTTSIEISDLDADGKLDLVVGGVDSNPATPKVAVLRNLSTPGSITTGTFSSPVMLPIDGAWTVAVGELDGDGKPDIVATNIGLGFVTVFKNASTAGNLTTGSFASQTTITTGGRPLSISIGDMDGDGKSDLTIGDEGDKVVSVFRNLNIGVPSISSFSPQSGPIGTTVTITGANFDNTPANNIVYFGATNAPVIGASTTALTVNVPPGATYQPITVTVNGMTAYSSKPFNVTFPGGGVIDATSFGPKVDFASGATLRSQTIVDLDGDGKADLITTNDEDNTISIFRNNSEPGSITSVSFFTKIDLPAGSGPRHVAAADLDGDGKKDLVLANGASASISVFRNTSTPSTVSFGSRIDFNTAGGAFDMAVGDMDGDGKTDIVVATASNAFSILRNTSFPGLIYPGSFVSPIEFATGSNPKSLAIGDLDGDGKPDVVVLKELSNTVSVLRNLSSSGAITSASLASAVDFTVGSGLTDVEIGDLDGDGKPDLAIANSSGVISILRNTSTPGTISTGSFAANIDVDAGSGGTNSVAIGDLDGDGKADLAVVETSITRVVSIIKNNSVSGTISVGSFANKVDFSIGAIPFGVIAGDLDGDGKLDLAVASSETNMVAILRNTIAEDTSPPSVLTLLPPDNATGVSLSTNLVITFNETVQKGTGNILIRKTSDNSTVQTIDVTGSSVTLSGATLTINPSSDLLNSTEVYVTIPNSAVKDLANNNYAGIIDATTWNFTTVTVDTTPPQIINKTVTSVQLGMGEVMAVQISDPESGIVGAPTVEYRSVSSGGTPNLKNMDTYIGFPYNYGLGVQASDIGELGIEYRFRAVNGYGLDNTSLWYLLKVWAHGTGLTIPYESFGDQVSNYRIVAVPLDLSPKTVSDVFEDDLGIRNNKKWRVARYENGTTNQSYTSSIEPGNGYWLVVKARPEQVIDSGPGTTVQSTSDQPFSVALKSGWNQIGNPYNFNISWADVQTANAGLPGLRVYNTGTHADGSRLNKFEGGFVNVSADRTIVFPVVKNASVSRLSEEETVMRNAIDGPDWEVNLKLEQGALKNLISGVGMRKAASPGFDVYDGFSMPRFGDYLEVNHNKILNDFAYSKDIVPSAEEFIWDLSIETSLKEEEIRFTWDNTFFGDNEKDLILWDVSQQRPVNMREFSGYSFQKSRSKHFKVIFGNKGFIEENTKVDGLIIHQVYPNPAGADLTVSFATPREELTTVEILDMMGRKTAVVFEGALPGGHHQVTWQRDLSLSPPAGLFIVQVKAGQAMAQRRVVLK